MSHCSSMLWKNPVAKWPDLPHLSWQPILLLYPQEPTASDRQQDIKPAPWLQGGIAWGCNSCSCASWGIRLKLVSSRGHISFSSFSCHVSFPYSRLLRALSPYVTCTTSLPQALLLGSLTQDRSPNTKRFAQFPKLCCPQLQVKYCPFCLPAFISYFGIQFYFL